MKIYKNGKEVKQAVLRYGADKKPAFVADAAGDKIWYPASDYTFEDTPVTTKKKTILSKPKKRFLGF